MQNRVRIVMALLSVPAVAAPPPPPPPPGAIARATKIISIPTEDHLPTYLRLFSKNVSVFQNDKLVAAGASAWAAYLKRTLFLHHKTLNISYGNPIMVVETLDDMSWHGPEVEQDCCRWARLAVYHLGNDGSVDTVRFTENDSFWAPPEHPKKARHRSASVRR